MVTTAEAIPCGIAEARGAVYRFLRAALDKPSAEQHGWLISAGFRQRLEQLATDFGVEPPAGELVPAGTADHEARYLACFEVGMPEPPVVLLAGHWNRREPVPAVIHEHKLYYQRFGASALIDPGEPADHLLNELTFLIHLDELLRASRHDVGSLLRARRDFLARHVVRWIGQAAQAAVANHLPGVYRALLAILAAAVDQDHELTEASQTIEKE
jgi:DMSO reductase family type II enzyme chaperone